MVAASATEALSAVPSAAGAERTGNQPATATGTAGPVLAQVAFTVNGRRCEP